MKIMERGNEMKFARRPEGWEQAGLGLRGDSVGFHGRIANHGQVHSLKSGLSDSEWDLLLAWEGWAR